MGYLGSKAASGAYQAIISQMPPHDLYIETHLGGGAVMARKPAAPVNIGVDIDPITLACAAEKFSDDVQLVNADILSFLDTFDFSPYKSPLLYVDPPYLPETRTSSARYRHEYTRENHIELIDALKQIPAAVMISGYPSELYDSLLSNWRSIRFQVMTRGGVRTEQIWMNFPEGDAYCATFAGSNYQERQRIKRKAERWKANYAALSCAERLAILSGMLSVHD
ncbi:DNA adenine methylase [Rahnella aceris]|uniref:DNA adenine methylase n=1 Tax=Rahnella sp. (strain Y9602) TaxID=2703885 RepID=UPI003FD4968F